MTAIDHSHEETLHRHHRLGEFPGKVGMAHELLALISFLQGLHQSN